MSEFNISFYSLLIQHFIASERIIQIKEDTILFQEKDPVDYIYLLMSGNLALGRHHIKGKEFILKILKDEEIIIEYQLFKDDPTYHFYVKTLTDCELLKIKKDQFEDYLMNDKKLLASMTSWLSTRYLKAQMKCQDLIINGKKGGLYSMLIRLANSYGVRTEEGVLIDLVLTHQELANLTFGTREVVQRLLKELREDDIISYDHQKFTIKNMGHLKREVDCQHCPIEICGVN